MSEEIKKIISGNKEEIASALHTFLENNKTVFTFEELNHHNYREKIWKVLFDFISNDTYNQLHVSCLAAIRTLSRDKTDLDQLITEERLDLLLKRACLKNEDSLNLIANRTGQNIAVEALKCLCNIIFNSPVAAAICTKNKSIEGIVNRLKMYKESGLPIEIKMFDMKILFLITALCEEVRPKLKEELHGLTYLIEELERMIATGNQASFEHNSDLTPTNDEPSLSNMEVDIICEILKVLFNLTVRTECTNIDEEEEAHYIQLVTVLRKLLLIETDNNNKMLDLHNHVINLLTNMPNKCYSALVVPVQKDEEIPKSLQYEEQNMKAVYEIYQFLKHRFSDEVTIKNLQELLAPVLTVLLKAATGLRVIRKYLRLKILPPLHDVHNRPEQGSSIRNCLCRLLTTPITDVRDLVADFLFVLCKENVNRMIKYTGYGNAAGLFAQRGLLGGGKPGESRYSSDSEDSDTEEYREHKRGINPVTGCYEPPQPSATANMTEEQKEYEAMKLVSLIDDLTKKGIVQPCKIGEDGRPEPIEHVLQLQEGLPSQQVHNSDGSD